MVMDITALYPSVPREEGLNYLEKGLNSRLDQSVPSDFLVDLKRLVLTMNTFEWDKKLYTQQDGTSIGTRAAPTLAGLFVGGLEEKVKKFQVLVLKFSYFFPELL